MFDDAAGTTISTRPSWPRSPMATGPSCHGRRRHRQDADAHLPGGLVARAGRGRRRILLLTFTRRAADDMLARAAALIGRATGRRRPRGAPSTPWPTSTWPPMPSRSGCRRVSRSSTRRRRRRHGPPAGRARPGRHRGPVPRSADAGRGVLALRQHPAAASVRCWPPTFRGASRISMPSPRCSGPSPRASGSRRRRLRRPACCSGGRPAPTSRSGRTWPAMFDHVLVDEYQDVNTLQVDIVRRPSPGRPRPHRRGRRRPGHLRVPWRRRPHLHELAAALPDTTVDRARSATSGPCSRS